MRNFDIIKDIDGLRTIYRYCATAEDFQVANPMVSATQARLALETMVKTVYRLKGWQIGERASLLSLTTDERFTAFIDSVLDRRIAVTDIDVAHRTNTGCLLAEIAYKLNRPIKWDIKNEKIIGDEQAARLCDRAYSAPWVLPA